MSNELPPLVKGSDIGTWLTEQLSSIRQANGFATDIGAVVYRGKRAVDDDEPPCCSIIEGEDRPGEAAGRETIRIAVDIAIVAYGPCDPDNPNDMAHKMIRDIKKLLWSKGTTLQGGKGNQLKYVGRDIGARPDGKALVMAVVHLTVTFAETLVDA